MGTFTSSSYSFVSPHSFLTRLRSRLFPSCFCGVIPGKKPNLVSLRLNPVRGLEFWKEKKRVSPWFCWCKKRGENDGDLALEAEILEFMRNSEKPEAFPSKKELVDAGRMDLVEGIKRQEGWLAMGWDLDDDIGYKFKENGFPGYGVKDSEFEVKEKKWDDETSQERVQSKAEISSGSALDANSSCSSSSSGRSLGVAAEDDCGIEGILSRLERERNKNLGFGFREKGDNTFSQSNDYEEVSLVEASMDAGDGSSTDNLRKLSDAWEFEENEIMNAQDKLRSIRGRLVVLEGKMALAVIDTQKTVEEKQKRIDNAHRALQLLRTACIVWPNSASEVLLAGSFDGWATKREMERSSTGVFSLCLKLYPGKYEIKFIVDGQWTIDPLRPIVSNNGYENNLLIIT
ncbi:hypothetical protein PTKIN_Ptkin02bG0097900 [Pterospermum kingtungense]